MGPTHLLFLLKGTIRFNDYTARQELNSAGNIVAAAFQSLTRRKPKQGLAKTDIKIGIPNAIKLQRIILLLV
jgi:hypothetical protein